MVDGLLWYKGSYVVIGDLRLNSCRYFRDHVVCDRMVSRTALYSVRYSYQFTTNDGIFSSWRGAVADCFRAAYYILGPTDPDCTSRTGAKLLRLRDRRHD